MQLDKTRIAIRERDFGDILDLSLSVLRAHALPLGALWLIGALPAMALNQWLLAESLAAQTDEFSMPTGYMWWYAVLIAWEIPLATAPMTLYLGQMVFAEKPDVGRLFKDFVGSLPQLILFQVVLRGMLVAMFWMIIPWVCLFVFWPYLNEVLLLERNPWWKRTPNGSSTFSRAWAVHSGHFSDLFARWLGSVLLGATLSLLIWGSLWYVHSMLSLRWQFDNFTFAVELPVAVWIVIGYFTVVRFLSYIDLRIRKEGWEIELAMRAEAKRLLRQVA